MMFPTTFDDLITLSQTNNLYQKLINQLNKDFLLANIDLSFDEDVLPTSLKYVLHDTVYHLIQEKFSEYLNLLYIVDVSEEKIKQLKETDSYELAEHVTFLILQREWQKVWYRSKY